ncbi:MAG: hypothetical protein A2506_09560 [Elusimicrobia bacterium RIFOXYD12_FULL_66_9]|nr:MAG: hypothetical protein A2506_09560 [Elusimicrobia bacterium RIFOXYD12_FULL_66_9]
MPSYKDWLRASWDDYVRRWPTLMAVAGVGGAATLLGAFLPLLAALLASSMGVETWTAFGLGGSVALGVGFWLSTWTQAAILRAVVCDEGTAEALSRSWEMTSAFAWVLCLFMLAAGGGFYLLLVPGILLGVLFFFAPVYQMSGEAEGMRAMELSWARVRPRMGEAGLRLSAAGLITMAPSWIPFVGWLIAPFWSPFGIVASARLARDLRDAAPDAQPPRLGALVAGLSLVCALGVGLSCWGGLRAYSRLREAALSGNLFAAGLDQETGNALIAVLSGTASEGQRQKAFDFAVVRSSVIFTAP